MTASLLRPSSSDGALLPLSPTVALPAGVVACGLRIVDVDGALDALAAAGVASAIDERAVARRRAEHLAGRRCASVALAALGCTAPVGRDAAGAPVWPAGFVGSISHARGHALAVAAPHDRLAGLGVDVEAAVAPEVAAELADQVLDAAERARLIPPLGTPSLAFAIGFSAKEALYKCLYPLAGRFMDFDAARVVAVEGGAERGVVRLALACDWAPGLPAGRALHAAYAVTPHGVETLVALPTAPSASASARSHGPASA